MSMIYHQYQANGIHLIRVDTPLEEQSIHEIVDILTQVYQPTQATYVIVDLSDSYVLPIRMLAAEIKRCYREYVGEAPLYLAIIVELSVAQVMTTVLKTLMRRDPIQLFTGSATAQEWLILERNKLSA